METDSLRYGFKIFKTRVPTAFLIVSAGTVPNSARFAEAAALAARLQKFADDQHLKKTQPVIAQFNPASKDSTFVKVGFYIDREAKPGGGIQFNRMPVGGPLYGAVFSGKFDKRQRAYNALIQYYTDHSYQSAILPFEMYLDDHLPVSDTDKVLVRVTFSGYF
jgi:effector-binding domain-containing protein